jgi:hypothetical protein
MPLTPIASGSQHSLRYVVEATPGTTPANPVMTEIPIVSTTLGGSRETLTSNSQRKDRQIPAADTGVDNISGDIAIELAPTVFDDFLASALCGTWTDNVLKAGTALNLMTIEREVMAGLYARYVGCLVNTLSLSIQPNAYVTGTFGMIGLSNAIAAAPLAANTPAPGELAPFNSFTGTLKIDDTVFALASGIELSLQNGAAAKYPLFSRVATALLLGKSNCSGTMTTYVTQEAPLLQKYINDNKSTLEFTVTRGAWSYDFLVPCVTFTGAGFPVQNEQEIVLNVPFQATFGADAGTNLQITRREAV